jgi:hypothetical protein
LYQSQGAVFDLPEEIAKDLLAMELPAGNTITKISKVILQLVLLKFVAKHVWMQLGRQLQLQAAISTPGRPNRAPEVAA